MISAIDRHKIASVIRAGSGYTIFKLGPEYGSPSPYKVINPEGIVYHVTNGGTSRCACNCPARVRCKHMATVDHMVKSKLTQIKS